MHVAAGLHRETGEGRAAQVLCHDGRRAPQKSERRRQHSGVTHRDELCEPSFGLRFEDGYRVLAAGRRLKCRQARSWDLEAERLSGRETLGDSRYWSQEALK